MKRITFNEPISFHLFKMLIYILLVILVIIGIFPFLTLFVNATRSTQQIQQGFSLFPSRFLQKNIQIFRDHGLNLLSGFKNSLIISVSASVLSLYFSSLTAYAFAAYDFKGKTFLYSVIIFLILIPTQLSLAAFAKFMLVVGLYDTYIPLIIPAIATPATVFFMRQYLSSVFQHDLLDAARIDGAGEIAIFHKIMLPILKPALATMAIFTMVALWNNLITPTVLITSREKYTMPMIVRLLTADIYSTEYGAIYLGISLTIIPLVVSYLLLSKYIIRGLTLGAVKG